MCTVQIQWRVVGKRSAVDRSNRIFLVSRLWRPRVPHAAARARGIPSAAAGRIASSIACSNMHESQLRNLQNGNERSKREGCQ